MRENKECLLENKNKKESCHIHFNKPISATQCFVETNDIVIDSFPEY